MSSAPRVAWVSNALSMVTLMVPQMRQMQAWGIHVTAVCSARDPAADGLRDAGLAIVDAPIPRLRSLASPGTARALASIPRLRRIFRRERFDTIYTVSAVPGFLGRMAANGLPLRVVHGVFGWPFHTHQARLTRTAYIAAERMAARSTHVFTFESEDDLELGRRLGIVGGRQEVAIVGTGIDLDRVAEARRGLTVESVRGELGIPRGALVASMIARWEPVKNHAQLLRAAALLRRQGVDCRLVLAGYGDPAPLRHLATELGLREEVQFPVAGPGPLSGALLDQFVKISVASDVSVLCSHREGVPRSPLVPMACGVPLVLTDIPGSRRLALEDGARLVAVDDDRALADAIAELGQPAPGHEQGERGRNLVRTRFDQRAVFERTREVLLGEAPQAVDRAFTPMARVRSRPVAKGR